MKTEIITDPHEIRFPKLGWTFHIDPTAFRIGKLEIQWYGILIALGLGLALLYCFPKMKKRFGIDPDKAVDAVLAGIIGGIVGARAYYVAFRWEDYKGDIKAILNTRNGGLAIYGGIIGALICGLIFCRIKKIKMLPMLDITVLGFLIGQGIGRWGNFTNQEAFGTNTNSIFGMTGGTIQETIAMNTLYTDGSMTGLGVDYLKTIHPCFLYESVWCLLGFVILSTYSKHRKYDGQILLMYMAWYGAERAVVEGLRTDSLMIGNIRVSQALSACICIASVILQIVLFFRRKRDPERFRLWADIQNGTADAAPETGRADKEETLTETILGEDEDTEEENISSDENGEEPQE